MKTLALSLCLLLPSLAIAQPSGWDDPTICFLDGATGSFISIDGDSSFILSCAHGLNGEGSRAEGRSREGKRLACRVVAFDDDGDAAILKFNGKAMKPAKIATAPARNGDQLWYCGFPLGGPLQTKTLIARQAIQSVNIGEGAPIFGDSGGPVRNANGEIVGVISGTDAYGVTQNGQVYRTGGNEGFYCKWTTVNRLVEQVRAKGYVETQCFGGSCGQGGCANGQCGQAYGPPAYYAPQQSYRPEPRPQSRPPQPAIQQLEPLPHPPQPLNPPITPQPKPPVAQVTPGPPGPAGPPGPQGPAGPAGDPSKVADALKPQFVSLSENIAAIGVKIEQHKCDLTPVTSAIETNTAAIVSLTEKIDALVNKPAPPPVTIPPAPLPEAEQHVVILADHNAPYWQKLAQEIERTKKTYHGLQESPLPEFTIGIHPQAVVYKNSVPIRIVKGQYQVEDLLARLSRGDAI